MAERIRKSLKNMGPFPIPKNKGLKGLEGYHSNINKSIAALKTAIAWAKKAKDTESVKVTLSAGESIDMNLSDLRGKLYTQIRARDDMVRHFGNHKLVLEAIKYLFGSE